MYEETGLTEREASAVAGWLAAWPVAIDHNIGAASPIARGRPITLWPV